MNTFYVFIGSGIGGAIRYLISEYYSTPIGFSTILANIIACLILGVVVTFFNFKNIDSRLFIFISVGICGGLSTFSTFELDNYRLISQSQIIKSIFYTVISMVFGLVALYLPIFIGNKLYNT